MTAPPVERRFASASSRLLLAKIIATAAVSITAIIAARVLGPTGRGVLALELTVATLTMLITALGVTVSCRVLLVDERDPVALGEHIGLALLLTLAQGLLAILVGVAVLPLVDVTLSVPEAIVLALYGMSLLAGTSAMNVLYAYGQFSLAGALEVSGGLTGLVITGLGAAAGSKAVPLYLGALGSGWVVVILGALVCLRANGHRVAPRYAPTSWRRLVRMGVPAMGLTFSQSAAYRLDRYLVGLYLSPAAVGLYSVAATGAELLRLVPTSVGQVLFHRVAALRTSARKIRLAYRATILITGLVVLLLVVIGDWLVTTIFGDAYRGSTGAFRILLLGEIAVASFLIDSSALAGRGEVGRASLSAAAGVVVVTVLDLLLIERYGIEGAAWASVAGYAFMAGLARYCTVRGSVRTPSSKALTGSGVSIPP